MKAIIREMRDKHLHIHSVGVGNKTRRSERHRLRFWEGEIMTYGLLYVTIEMIERFCGQAVKGVEALLLV